MDKAMILNDVYDDGAILTRNYDEQMYSLSLWHFAYNEGKEIILYQMKSSSALDMAYDYWDRLLNQGKLPMVLSDHTGQFLERKWVTIAMEDEPLDSELLDDEPFDEEPLDYNELDSESNTGKKIKRDGRDELDPR